MKLPKFVSKSLFVVLAGVLIFLAFNKHSRSGYFNYHSEIWADKAGYYVYLPAAFEYRFQASAFPASVDTLTGHGFRLNLESEKVETKMTYGVALLQLPFYLLADIFAPYLDMESNGFSPIYHWSVNVAAVFYLLLGLFFLNGFLKARFKSWIVFVVLSLILLGTNLYFYSIDETGMSHVYSFFLFSLFLYTIQKYDFLEQSSFAGLLSFGALCGLIFLIRPTNAIFLSVYFLLDVKSTSQIFVRVRRLTQWKFIVPILTGAALIALPQLAYWNYLAGTPFYYSYADEGFNWMSPQLHKTWFSPNNGLFLYTPLYLFIVGSVIYMVTKRIRNGLMLFGVFTLLSYVLSSWWAWNFGCSFGARSFVEYTALFSLPLAHVIKRLSEIKWYKSLVFWLFLLLCVGFSLKMTYTYDECFYSESEWDWQEYIRLVRSPTN